MPFLFDNSKLSIFFNIFIPSFVIANAFYEKKQFYPSIVYITKSTPSIGIMYLQGAMWAHKLGQLIVKIFFGQLRTAEVEHLIERSWYAVTETCLAFTVFRDDLSPKFVALFTLLLFLKCFHWLTDDRVDYMERSPNISMFFHIRVVSLLILLGILDIVFVYFAYQRTMTKGASVQLVFGFEYAILFAVILNITMKYILHLIDLHNDAPWEDKAIYLLHTELIMGFLKLTCYLIFVYIMMKIHTFPLFVIRPMYLALRNLKKALNDVIMSRRAIRYMNQYYPDATSQDIENFDNICIICRENMSGNGTCKKLPCNHIFHTSCLRSWFQRQQTCPTCRMNILRGVNHTRPPMNAAPAANDNNNNNLNDLNNLNLNQNNNNEQANNNNLANGPFPVPPTFLAANPLFFQRLQQNLRVLRTQQQQQQQQQPQAPGSNDAPRNSETPGAAANNVSSNSNNNNNPSSSINRNESNSNANSSANESSLPNLTRPANQDPINASIPSTIFPFLQAPPFAMPHLPASTLLRGFSDEELRYMEGQTRENVEARIKCLMDVKTLITAASFRLQQYNCVLLNSQNKNSIGTQTEPTRSFDGDNLRPNESSLSDQPTPSSSSSMPTMGSKTQKSATANEILLSDENDEHDNEIIRQRRLQRFLPNQMG
ncbi:E3 ubiquitin-protein ligase synoviolin [Sarcoptes scabiei]|uniref:RING-type E3 ubiquitin transferase n=1 Tax=Sarcoptes scabiei TaxID=52283 RepID=A0A834R0F9_SARSC|nr:E3 ubiquitin-protein ligase synoviolin [Sarcoptes scabiei]